MHLTPNDVLLGLVWYMVFVVSTTAHEAAHAWVAYLLGDRTAYHAGQVTLNPLPHLQREPIGAVLVPFVSYFLGGWMMGWASAPYDPYWAQRYPRRAGWMALAGPTANLILALLAVAAIRIGLWMGYFDAGPGLSFKFPYVAKAAAGVPDQAAELVSIFFTLNFILLLFNLIPVPPLDGGSIVQLFMRRETAVRWQQTLRQPSVSTMGLLIAVIVFYKVSPHLFKLALQIIYPEYSWK